MTAILEINDPSKLADHVVSSLPIKISKKQQALAQYSMLKRLELVYTLLKSEYQVLETENKIKHRIKDQVETSQREYYLNEQLKAIKKELGESGSEDVEDEHQQHSPEIGGSGFNDPVPDDDSDFGETVRQ